VLDGGSVVVGRKEWTAGEEIWGLMAACVESRRVARRRYGRAFVGRDGRRGVYMDPLKDLVLVDVSSGAWRDDGVALGRFFERGGADFRRVRQVEVMVHQAVDVLRVMRSGVLLEVEDLDIFRIVWRMAATCWEEVGEDRRGGLCRRLKREASDCFEVGRRPRWIEVSMVCCLGPGNGNE
jgi:hypothetical protein